MSFFFSMCRGATPNTTFLEALKGNKKRENETHTARATKHDNSNSTTSETRSRRNERISKLQVACEDGMS